MTCRGWSPGRCQRRSEGCRPVRNNTGFPSRPVCSRTITKVSSSSWIVTPCQPNRFTPGRTTANIYTGLPRDERRGIFTQGYPRTNDSELLHGLPLDERRRTFTQCYPRTKDGEHSNRVTPGTNDGELHRVTPGRTTENIYTRIPLDERRRTFTQDYPRMNDDDEHLHRVTPGPITANIYTKSKSVSGRKNSQYQ